MDEGIENSLLSRLSKRDPVTSTNLVVIPEEFDAIRFAKKEPRFDVKHDTILVDFGLQDKKTERLTTRRNVVVLTSDGEKGSISNLNLFNDPKLFAEDLKRRLGKENIPTILVGGNDNSIESVQLVENIMNELKAHGFDVDPERNDVGGNKRRRATLYRDSVFVHSESYDEHERPQKEPDKTIQFLHRDTQISSSTDSNDPNQTLRDIATGTSPHTD